MQTARTKTEQTENQVSGRVGGWAGGGGAAWGAGGWRAGGLGGRKKKKESLVLLVLAPSERDTGADAGWGSNFTCMSLARVNGFTLRR